MSDETSQKQKRETSHAARFTALSVLGHAIFLFGFLVFLLFMIPNYERLFHNLQAPVNGLTRSVLAVSKVAHDYAMPLVLLVVAFLVIDAVVHFVLYRASPRRSYVWGWAITVALAVIVGLTFFTLQLSIAALQ